MRLGLPLEYQKYPEYFDMFNINDDTEIKNQVIEQILIKHNVKTVLDMTCGTGSICTAQELRDMLAKSGFYEITQYGMDGGEFIDDQTISILTVAKKRIQ